MPKEQLQTLLHTLDEDTRQAGVAYRDLHQRLARFFRFNNTQDPEALADEALDRLAQRIARQDQERIDSPQAFALGIARHLLQEDSRRRLRESDAALEWNAVAAPADAKYEDLLQLIERCLSGLREDQRSLLQNYYQSQGRAKIDHHRHLAQEMGLMLNTLRNRVMRTRKLLDQCVHQRSGDVLTSGRTEDRKGRKI